MTENESPDGNADAPESAETPAVTPEEFHDRTRRGERVNLLDVRNREEYEEWHISGEGVETTVVPYAEFVAAKARGEVGDLVGDLNLDPEEPIVAVCPRGEASATVADLLRDEGFDARNLAGGMQAWARVYVGRELPVGPDETESTSGAGDASATSNASDGVTVIQYDRPARGCLSYLVVSGDEAAVIDPLRAFADRYVADAEEYGATLRYAIDTHVHADHLSGVRRLADGDADRTDADGTDAGDVQAVLPAGATERGLAFADRLSDETDSSERWQRLRLIEDGDELQVGDATLTALHAPGHTTELTALRLGNLLFSGDALFVDSYGRPDLEQGSEGVRDLAGTLYDTLTQRLLALPDDLLVAPGHRTPDSRPNPNETYTARLATVRERLDIPDEKEAFVNRVLDSLPPRPANYEEIIPANLGTESVDDETAAELELGPNNCAVAADD